MLMLSVYLGDCAALTFLQHIQDLIETEGGSPAANADVSSVSAIEEAQPQEDDITLDQRVESSSSLRELVDVFFAAVREHGSHLKSATS